MKAKILIAALAAAATLAWPAAPALAQRHGTPAQRDWTRTVQRTPEGGYRIGNPNARVKLVEYLSLTCPHCAAFAHESGRLFPDHVRGGRVSVEYRNFYLDGLDIAAALLTRCAAPDNYFGITHAILGSQRQWMSRVNALTPAQRAELGGLPPAQVAQRLIPLVGLDAIGARFGITPRMRQTCINEASLDSLQALHNGGQQLGVRGTPTFLINGSLASVNTWAGIEPLLRGQ
ncbi:MAG TPA: thioredoxin domain-containing protein [Allosphingosinicella sp.]|jgi:protein-disulfide isomerase|nr:thioredoxin domain-containing protein [Allosphingosinicella sp.]